MLCVLFISFSSAEITEKATTEKQPSIWELIRKSLQKQPDSKPGEYSKASELLDKYTATRDKFNSFISKTENTIEFENTPTKSNSRFGYTHLKNYNKIDFRFDGRRSYTRRHYWGDISKNFVGVPENDPFYSSKFNNDDLNLSRGYGRNNIKDPGFVTIHKDFQWKNAAEVCLARGYKGHEVLGYMLGDDQRIDVVLRTMTTDISVRDRMEEIGGSQCYVIDTQTKKGKYTVWIDPSHGYNIARAEVLRQGGDLESDNATPIQEGDQKYILLSNVQFKQIDGVWIPVGADIDYRWNLSEKYGYTYWEKIHHKVTDFIINPDHEALGSFEPDDIQNGAKVKIAQVPDINYTWQDGKVVDANGKIIVDFSKRTSEGENKNAKD